MRDAKPVVMPRLKDTTKLLNAVLRVLPVIPMLWPRKKASAAPYVFGALGIAIAGGITAVMFFSPRTRNRTLGIAKDSYGKVLGQLEQLGIGERLGLSSGDPATTTASHSNGLGAETGGASHATPTTY